ncbi:hypothetical protein LOY54_15895 [Pseudomonas sp. B21-032]|uniref:hypothetical protein n=1 Tax=Pseudomonas sp. B21-032 TaxID=2895483 RepID=UPI00215F8335|nr:hypothetical protein [Pseudomonas sp. B21-032]UVL59532.1 hypothetical protein LOY54_15895 [Pseudomonas sp. B21-032]
MTFDEFIEIVTKLTSSTQLNLYASDDYSKPYTPIETTTLPTGHHQTSFLVGPKDKDENILGPEQKNLTRENKVGFVTATFGGEDEFAIGASHFGADSSQTATLINRELRKLLKTLAHKNLIDANGNTVRNHYWTDSALASGKNWHRFLRKGEQKRHNLNLGYRPGPT